MQDECKIEPKLLQQMFPDLNKLIELHKAFLDQLISKYQQSSNKFIESIGDILLEIVNIIYIFIFEKFEFNPEVISLLLLFVPNFFDLSRS